MDKSRGLFVVLDGLWGRCQRTGEPKLARGVSGALRDFRALGFRIIGVVTDGEGDPSACGFEFDAVVRGNGSAGWEFPPEAWSVARRLSVNVRRSLLCSPDVAHASWARNAGLKRFDTPGALFGI
jgi:hypothetical protein